MVTRRRTTKNNATPRSKDAPDAQAEVASDLTRREAADYIAALTDELKSIAHAAGLSFVAYLLSMAREEAQVERSREDSGA